MLNKACLLQALFLLQDSVSSDNTWKDLYRDNNIKSYISYKKRNNIVFIQACVLMQTTQIWDCTNYMPVGYRPYIGLQHPALQTTDDMMPTNNVSYIEVWSTGMVRMKQQAQMNNSYLSAYFSYVCDK